MRACYCLSFGLIIEEVNNRTPKKNMKKQFMDQTLISFLDLSVQKKLYWKVFFFFIVSLHLSGVVHVASHLSVLLAELM